jgi:hypothetical protein
MYWCCCLHNGSPPIESYSGTAVGGRICDAAGRGATAFHQEPSSLVARFGSAGIEAIKYSLKLIDKIFETIQCATIESDYSAGIRDDFTCVEGVVRDEGVKAWLQYVTLEMATGIVTGVNLRRRYMEKVRYHLTDLPEQCRIDIREMGRKIRLGDILPCKKHSADRFNRAPVTRKISDCQYQCGYEGRGGNADGDQKAFSGTGRGGKQ